MAKEQVARSFKQLVVSDSPMERVLTAQYLTLNTMKIIEKEWLDNLTPYQQQLFYDLYLGVFKAANDEDRLQFVLCAKDLQLFKSDDKLVLDCLKKMWLYSDLGTELMETLASLCHFNENSVFFEPWPIPIQLQYLIRCELSLTQRKNILKNIYDYSDENLQDLICLLDCPESDELFLSIQNDIQNQHVQAKYIPCLYVARSYQLVEPPSIRYKDAVSLLSGFYAHDLEKLDTYKFTAEHYYKIAFEGLRLGHLTQHDVLLPQHFDVNVNHEDIFNYYWLKACGFTENISDKIMTIPLCQRKPEHTCFLYTQHCLLKNINSLSSQDSDKAKIKSDSVVQMLKDKEKPALSF